MNGKILIPIPDKDTLLCRYCGIRTATKLCDAPIMRVHNIGHPPVRRDNLSIAYEEIKNQPMEYSGMCNAPICDECATEVGGGIDFCPHCMERIKAINTHNKRR